MTISAAVDVIRRETDLVPEVGIILGTGLGRLADAIAIEAAVPYTALPGFPEASKVPDGGRLVFGTVAGRAVVAMQGRFHRYEGHSLQQIGYPIQVMHALGATTLIASNGAGSMHPLWAPGDLVLVADHINLLGDNPLVGPNDRSRGPRFPDMSAVYDAELRTLVQHVARERQIMVREGVYVAVTGPSMGSPAEYRMLRMLGADLVGMSTVPEAIVAVHAGMRVLALVVVTDQCLPDALEPVNPDAVMATVMQAEGPLAELVVGTLERWDE